MNRKLIIAILALTALPVLAMPPKNIDRDGKTVEQQKQHTEMMTQVLDLRADQVVKFQEIMLEQHEARKALDRTSHEQRKMLHEETIQKLSAVLDGNQVERFEAFTQGLRMEKQKGDRGRKHPKPPAPVAE